MSSIRAACGRPPAIVSVSQAARELGLSRYMVRRAIADGALATRRLNGGPPYVLSISIARLRAQLRGGVKA